MTLAVVAENIGKKYTINHRTKGFANNTLRDHLMEYVKKPFQKHLSASDKETFWALRNICFSIKHGERIGFIGPNGAGKSTLLKILTRITEPSTGKISIKGKVACILEVGAGFHTELTGRENIFLNGAILGMSKREIQKKFDEIVEFSEIEKFIDTPVKWYSTGMNVRLGFSIASYLRADIMVMDEILAVGDAEFQKKSLTKMQSIAENEGRTILFVSHNMGHIKFICNRAILLKEGMIKMDSCNIDEAVDAYLK
jgi:lipopolysaccharide transport system ATP-binding protein